MKRLLTIIFALSLTACGVKVEVPPAYVGKVLTKNGYSPETVTPSKFRLPKCWAYCDKLVLLEASDNTLEEEIIIFMPKDRLNLTADIRGTYSIPSDNQSVDLLYSRIPSKDTASKHVSVIPATQVYSTYGIQAVRGIVRSELAKYSIQEVLENRESVSASIHAAIETKLKAGKTPLVISRFELADLQPPSVIVEAQEAAKEREIDIQRAEADAQVDLVKAERDLEIAKKNRLVDREKAEAIAEQNKIAADSITPEVLAYKQLETAAEIVKMASQNGNTVFLPMPSSSDQVADLTSAAALSKLLGKELAK